MKDNALFTPSHPVWGESLDSMPPHLPQSRLVGLIGAGIQASRTPGMHENEAREHGVAYVYRLIDLDQLGMSSDALPELLNWAQRIGFDGLNVTHPCKQSVIPLMHELSEDAKAIGAVNTVVFDRGRRVGHNTDGWGYAEAFKRGLSGVSIRKVVQLGAGGAGAAVAHALMTLGVGQLVLVDPVAQRAASLAEKLCARFGTGRARVGDALPKDLSNADGLVHATPTGMPSHPGLPLPESLLRPALWVSDIVYFPLRTELLTVAQSLGCRTLDGSAMAVFQAARALRLLSGIEPDVERMFITFHELGQTLDSRASPQRSPR